MSQIEQIPKNWCDNAYAEVFAGRLRRLEPSLPESAVSAAVFLAQSTLMQKNVCLDVAKVRRRSEVAEAAGDGELPSAEELQAWAEKYPAVFGVPGRFAAPLVVEGSRLYLQRYYRAECRLAEALRKRMEGERPLEGERSREPWEGLLRETEDFRLDASQREAIAKVLTNRLSVVTGGPGTGKTTLVCAALTALLIPPDGDEDVAATFNCMGSGLDICGVQMYKPDPIPFKVVACAPTGKAQARLREAIETEFKEHIRPEIQARLGGALPVISTTIHRLLGYNPVKMAYRHSSDNPIEADVVVADEASMADVLLMDRLMAAVPDSARVILLGDKRQLAAVENGSVLRDICDAWEGRPNVAALTTSHRFGADSALGRIQAAFHAENTETVITQLRRFDEGFTWREPAALKGLDAEMEGILAACTEFAAYRDAETVEEGFARFNTFRILCATRGGRYGTETMNRWMMAHMGISPYQHGYPVMVTVNDYENGLFNGDIGLCWADGNGIIRVWFQDGAREMKGYSFSQLPEHEPVFAMTVHKAQGSGFDTVLITLPECGTAKDHVHPLLTRELLYTAITRAKRRCILWGDEPQVRHCCERETLRMSGLAAKVF